MSELPISQTIPANPAERIIVALDCPETQALRLADTLKGRAHWLKVGMTLFYQAGATIVTTLKEMGFKVFVDLKLHDIPHQVQGGAAALTHAGADMLTLHCAGGVTMLQQAETSVREASKQLSRPKPITLGITVLTSLDKNDLVQVGVNANASEQVLKLAALTKGAGLSGVVASPHEAGALRALLGEAAAIVTPGIRLNDNDSDDQKRIATPAAALQAGASHIVVGRPITEAADVAAAFDNILRACDEDFLAS